MPWYLYHSIALNTYKKHIKTFRNGKFRNKKFSMTNCFGPHSTRTSPKLAYSSTADYAYLKASVWKLTVWTGLLFCCWWIWECWLNAVCVCCFVCFVEVRWMWMLMEYWWMWLLNCCLLLKLIDIDFGGTLRTDEHDLDSSNERSEYTYIGVRCAILPSNYVLN